MYTPATARDAVNILVVRLGAMGDIIHTLPAVASLKLSFPRASLTWVLEPRWLPLVEGNPFVDALVPFNRRSFESVRRVWKRLRAAPFDLAVDFQGLIKSALVATAARPERLFGYHRSQAREPLASFFYSNPVRTSSAHIVDQHLDLAHHAGAQNLVREFHLPAGSHEGVLPESPFVLANPFAGWKSKQWPAEFYSELAARMRNRLGIPLVLNLPPAASRPTLTDVHWHESGLSGLIAATRRALAVVGVDSGPLHLAAALGKPGVALFGPTDPGRNGPYGSSIHVLRSPLAATSYKRGEEIDPSMWQITPDEVFEALKSVLEPARRS